MCPWGQGRGRPGPHGGELVRRPQGQSGTVRNDERSRRYLQLVQLRDGKAPPVVRSPSGRSRRGLVGRRHKRTPTTFPGTFYTGPILFPGFPGWRTPGFCYLAQTGRKRGFFQRWASSRSCCVNYPSPFGHVLRACIGREGCVRVRRQLG